MATKWRCERAVSQAARGSREAQSAGQKPPLLPEMEVKLGQNYEDGLQSQQCVKL